MTSKLIAIQCVLHFIRRVYDACKLLALSKGSALLLHETLKRDVNSTDCRDALKEVGVVHISTSMALEFLERRNDVRPY